MVAVRPATPKTETIADIVLVSNTIKVYFSEKREDFWRIIKLQQKMQWSGACWQRTIPPKEGTPADRVAEIGNKLLAAGFIVRIKDDELRLKAITGDYKPEQTRWIKRNKDNGDYPGWFSISWGWGDDLYAAARKISGSRWFKPSVVAPPEQYEQVLDFADKYNFSLSAAAQELVAEAKKAKESMLIVSVKAKNRTIIADGTIPPALDVPEEVEVDASLRDYD